MFNPKARGYHAIYAEDRTNYCPGCGRCHWHIGRLMAECAFCGTALPLQATLTRGAIERPLFVKRGGELLAA